MAALGIEAANPAMTVKQLAAMIDMGESLLWRYLQPKKLCPAAMDAYKAGRIGLNQMVELAKLGHDEQAKELGKSPEAMRANRKRGSAPAERTGKLKVPLPSGRGVAIAAAAGEEITLEESADTLKEALKMVNAAIDKSLSAKSAQSVWKDLAAAV